LSQNPQLARSLGTRHRAAVGLTEETDAVCLVVSEETGAMSVSVYGKLTQDLDGESLRRVLTSLFRPAERPRTWIDFWQKEWRRLRPEIE
jgi:diadenylate cyclase